MNQKNITFEKITDFDPKFLIDKGFDVAPVLYIEDTDKFLDYKSAVDYINAI